MDDLIHAVHEDGPVVGALYALVPTERAARLETFGTEVRRWVRAGISVALWYPVADGQAAGFTFGPSASSSDIERLRAWLESHPAVSRVGSWADVSGQEEWADEDEEDEDGERT